MLHTVNKSPFECAGLDSCLRLACKGSAILLYEDGVFGALKDTVVSAKLAAAAGNFQVYALEPDLAARGIDPAQVIDGVTLVDYEGFVDLAVEHGPVNSWL